MNNGIGFIIVSASIITFFRVDRGNGFWAGDSLDLILVKFFIWCAVMSFVLVAITFITKYILSIIENQKGKSK